MILVVGCRKDPAPPNYLTCSCYVDSSSTQYFFNEQYDFAYQEISNDPNHPGYEEIILDPETVYYYLGRLSAIYQSAKDTIGSLHDMLFKYKVHNHGSGKPVLNTLTVKFTDSSSLRNELMNQLGYTSNNLLNEVYTVYGFNSFYFSQFNETVIMSGTNFYNVQATKNLLEGIPEIEQVELSYNFIDGNVITHQKIGEVDEFIFDYGWGDCPSGCFAHHYWKVQVDKQCKVNLVTEYGNELQ